MFDKLRLRFKKEHFFCDRANGKDYSVEVGMKVMDGKYFITSCKEIPNTDFNLTQPAASQVKS